MSRAFTVVDCEQRTPEWFAARCGRLTGSQADAIYARLKNGDEAASRRDLRVRLAIERITGVPQEDDYMNADMRRGVELEPHAIAAYEAATATLLETTGFLAHTTLPIGCSLDGHVNDFEGIVELKVPRSANHVRYLRAGGLPAEHRYQVAHNLFVSGARWADFCSFDPRFPEPLRLFRVRVERNDVEMKAYELAVRTFLDEIEKEVEAIRSLLPVGAVA